MDDFIEEWIISEYIMIMIMIMSILKEELWLSHNPKDATERQKYQVALY